ncbi:MAG: CHAT domain-containing protein [Rhizobiaceae bacterium]|nr:CHAT domain-containing protein [Rhizobiaceae bacterium]
MRIVWLVIMLLGLSVAAHAGGRYALVVGNSDYRYLPALPTAKPSAELVGSTLEGLGYDVTIALDQPRSTLARVIEHLAAAAEQTDASAVLVYFAGHAAGHAGETYLFSMDSESYDPALYVSGVTPDGLPLTQLLDTLATSPARAIVLLDPSPPLEGAPRGFDAIQPPPGMFVAMPNAPGLAVVPGTGPTTVFAQVLSRLLAEPGITTADLGKRLRNDVMVATTGQMAPWFADTLPAPLALAAEGPAQPAPAPKPADPADDQLWAMVRSQGTDAFLRHYLTFYPDGRHADEARALLAGNDIALAGTEPEASGPNYYVEVDPAESPDDVAAAEPPAEPEPDTVIGGLPPPEPLPLPAPLPAPISPAPEPDASVAPGDAVTGTPPIATAPPPKPIPLDGAVGGYKPSSVEPGAVSEPPLPPMEEPPLPSAEEPAEVSAKPVESVARYPTVDAPEAVAAAETFTVSIALTEEKLTEDVVAKPAPGGSVTEDGALELALPAGADEWPIDIDLLASGFDLVDGGQWSRRVLLFRDGDSDVVRFALKARSVSAARQRKLMVRFYHEGTFLGSASRPIEVTPEGGVAEASGSPAPASGAMMMIAPAPAAAELSTDIRIGDAVETPDLDVTVHYDDPDNLGSGLIVIHSPHIGPPVSAEFSTPAGMAAWLDSEYLRLVQLGLDLRGAQSLTAAPAADADSRKRFVMKVAEGIGADLYRNYVPDELKRVMETLHVKGKLGSIQITSNSPVLPWEIVRPVWADGTTGGFLGIDYRVARWAPRESGGQVDRPLNSIAFSGVATVAPAYDGNRELPFQQVEVDALSKLAGFRLIDGDFSSFEKLVGEVSTGFIHFSGHGAVNAPGTGAPVFAIQLLDQSLDPNTWRALSFASREGGNPFYFFNACDTGRAASLGGFVQGWGPAVLASGASGFIGGMWPLTDRAAASFSTGFYGTMSSRLGTGPVYVAEVLRDVRRQFYETGDPTYLAYTFYGNANLRVVAQ